MITYTSEFMRTDIIKTKIKEIKESVPIPKDMDGRVLKEIFKPNSEFAKVGEKERVKDRIKQLKELGKI